MAFLIGLVVYLLTNKWLASVLFSTALFIGNILSDVAARDNWGFTLIFGLPIVFVASLLGPYVVELRRGEDVDEETNAELEDDTNVSEEQANESIKP